MTLGEFLAARLGRILLFFAGGAAGALFLAATGTQTGVLLLLALVILPAFLGVQASDFLRQRNRIRELEEILEGPRARALVRGFSEGKPPEALCRRCGFATRFG